MRYLLCILILTLSLIVVATIEDECLAGKGKWTIPTITQGDDPVSNKRTLEPFCECEIGFYWNDTLKSCENDQEIRCVQTGGKWTGVECQCPEGTVKWTEGFGCDTSNIEPKTNTGLQKNPEIETKQDYLQILFVSILVVLGIIVCLYFIKTKRGGKQNENQ